MDAALFEAEGRFSWAVIARITYRSCIAAKSCCREGSIAPVLAESFGIREALSWIKLNNWSQVCIESDCLEVIQALRSQVHTDSYFGRIIAECINICNSLPDVSVVFVKRSANMAAHELARFSCLVADRCWTGGDLPSCVSDVIFCDSQ